MNPSPSSKAASAQPDNSSGGSPPSRWWLNLGVLAHVDAGKTSLTEALLHAGGALAEVGRVDAGTTQTDTLALERRRGITIRTAVATFQVGEVTVNMVDTPGHPDFIAEVDRSLGVLDGAVLVVSAVEGVQAQTVVLYRALRRLGVPAVFVVNKVDRLGADPDRVLSSIRQRLSPALVPLSTVRDVGTPEAVVVPRSWEDSGVAETVTAQLAEHDDDLFQDWVGRDGPPPPDQLWEVLTRLTRRGTVHPVLLASARTGTGVPQVLDTVTTLLPVRGGDPAAPVEGQIFKIERMPAGDRVCSIRMRAGTLAVRDEVDLGPDRVGTVTALEVFEPGGAVIRHHAVSGQIVRVRGLASARVGDGVGLTAATMAAGSFPPPALQTTLVARDPARGGDLLRALQDLADIDPLIWLRPDPRHGKLQISVYGAIQQEVVADTLASEYGVAVDFEAMTVLCVERPTRRAASILRIGDPGHLFGYTLGVTVEPIAPETGVEVVVTADRLSLPLHVYATVDGFRRSVLGYLSEALADGPHGWPVTDVRVTVTDSGYPPAGPTPSDVRRTTTQVVTDALRRAATVVCEPVDAFRVETTDDTTSSVVNLLARHHALPDPPQTADGITVITGTVPTAEVDAVRAGLSAAAHGQAVMESTLHHHAHLTHGPHR